MISLIRMYWPIASRASSETGNRANLKIFGMWPSSLTITGIPSSEVFAAKLVGDQSFQMAILAGVPKEEFERALSEDAAQNLRGKALSMPIPYAKIRTHKSIRGVLVLGAAFAISSETVF